MRFTWDEAKRKANLEKHGLDFADAHRVFEQPVVEFDDTRPLRRAATYCIGAAGRAGRVGGPC